jgi:hypothetical protein
MNEALVLTFAATVPLLCLGLLMWLARLEETLTDGLERPEPAEPTASPVASPVAVETPGAAA